MTLVLIICKKLDIILLNSSILICMRLTIYATAKQ